MKKEISSQMKNNINKKGYRCFPDTRKRNYHWCYRNKFDNIWEIDTIILNCLEDHSNGI
jgi:hypothetical protein